MIDFIHSSLKELLVPLPSNNMFTWDKDEWQTTSKHCGKFPIRTVITQKQQRSVWMLWPKLQITKHSTLKQMHTAVTLTFISKSPSDRCKALHCAGMQVKQVWIDVYRHQQCLTVRDRQCCLNTVLNAIPLCLFQSNHYNMSPYFFPIFGIITSEQRGKLCKHLKQIIFNINWAQMRKLS